MDFTLDCLLGIAIETSEIHVGCFNILLNGGCLLLSSIGTAEKILLREILIVHGLIQDSVSVFRFQVSGCSSFSAEEASQIAALRPLFLTKSYLTVEEENDYFVVNNATEEMKVKRAKVVILCVSRSSSSSSNARQQVSLLLS